MEVLNNNPPRNRWIAVMERMQVSARIAALLLAALWMTAGVDHASAAQTPEYQLKAVFLFNFTQFVEWPATAFESAESPIVIGVLGTDPFGAYLDETVRGETVNGRPLVVRRYAGLEKPDACHVLFVSRSEASRVKQVLGSTAGRSILTVSDLEEFTGNGGVIRFVTMNNKIRLRINLEAARSAGLVISSKLLRPADIVGPGEK